MHAWVSRAARIREGDSAYKIRVWDPVPRVRRDDVFVGLKCGEKLCDTVNKGSVGIFEDIVVGRPVMQDLDDVPLRRTGGGPEGFVQYPSGGVPRHQDALPARGDGKHDARQVG